MAGFGRDFGQKVDLIARIRQALQDYPAGVSMFKEFVQNADDAGARRMQICLDMRSHSASKTAWKQNAEDLQGPALLVYNDAVFDDGDFTNITHLGNSDKVTKVNKIGRFGVGVNVMYHLSDVPSFVSRDRFVFFDPHASFLPGVNPAMPGKSIFFLGEDQEVVAEYADMFTPFNAFGFSPDQPFNGTLFRMPLRNELLAESSRLSNHTYSTGSIQDLLQSFAREMGSCLIFLKSVDSISLSVWQPDAPAPSLLFSSALSAVPRDSFTRARLDAAAAGDGDLYSPTARIDTLEVVTECVETQSNIKETFVVSSQVGCSADSRLLHHSVIKAAGSLGKDGLNAGILSKHHPKLRLVPLAAVAVRNDVTVSPASKKSDSGDAADGTSTLIEDIVEHGKIGRLFCFLPLPITSGLPVHVNSTFEVSSSRQDFWKLDESSGGDGAVRGLWNVLIIQDAVIACYASLLDYLVSSGSTRSDVNLASAVYNLFPASSNVVFPFWRDALVCSFYETLGGRKLLHDSGSGSWFKPSDVTSLLSLPTGSSALMNVLADILKGHSVPFIDNGDFLPHEQLHLLHDHAGLKHMTPSHLMDILTHLHSSNQLTITHSNAISILPYLVSESPSPPQAQSLLISLCPLPIIPLISGHISRLFARAADNHHVTPKPLRILSAAEQQDARDFFSSISAINILDPTAATPEVVHFFLHEGVTSAYDVGHILPSDVPIILNAICDINSNVAVDSIKSVWTHLLLRSDEWYAAAMGFAVVPAFGKLLRPDAAARCCYFVGDEIRMPSAVVAALESNGIASVQFSSLTLNSNVAHPRWLSKAFLGHKGSELVVALRNATKPGHLQDADECDTLRRFFFSELRQYEEEWDEPARLALKQLPIHRMGSLHPTKNLSGFAAIDDDCILVGPTGGSTPIDPAWLASTFIVTSGIDDESGYEKLRLPKISAADWYAHHFFPSIDEFDASVRIAVLQTLLDTVHALRAERSFIEFLKTKGRFVTATGTIVHVRELVIPADSSSALLMDTSIAPAQDLTGEFRSQVLVELGARSRPDFDDIRRVISSLTAATKSGWTEDATAQSLKHIATSTAAVDVLSSLVSRIDEEPGDSLLDVAGRTLVAAAQVISCPSLEISVSTLPNVLRLLAISRHFLESNAAFEEKFAYRGKKLSEVLASSASDLVDRVSFFDSFCREDLGSPYANMDATHQSALLAVPVPNSRGDVAELVRRFEVVLFPAIYYLHVDDPILVALLNIGLRHIDNIVATHGLNSVLSIQRKLPELVAARSFWSCFCGASQPAHELSPWGSPDVERAIMAVSAEKWLPVLASLQFVADALIEVAETCAVAGVAASGHSVQTFTSVKLSKKSNRMSFPNPFLRSASFHDAVESAAQPASGRAGSRSPPRQSRQSVSATGKYDGIRCYDLSTLDSVSEKQGVSVCEKKLLESAKHALHNVHTLSRVLMSKVLVFDLNSAFYGQLFIQHINLLELTKSCVLRSLGDIKKTIKGDSGCNSNLFSNLILSLSSAAHAATLTLVDDAILNGGLSRTYSGSLAFTLEAQLQNLQHIFFEWLQENVTDFVAGSFPSLFKSKHMEFLITEIIPMMKRDSAELVTLFEASYAKAQNHVPISSPYFLSRVVLARDSGDAAAAAFRRSLQSNDLQRDYLNNLNRPPSTIFNVVPAAHDV